MTQMNDDQLKHHTESQQVGMVKPWKLALIWFAGFVLGMIIDPSATGACV